MNLFLPFLKKQKKHLLVYLVVLTVIISHSFNMFGYPYYENDEGVYMSQAWSVVTQHKLSPYTYWYDHAPAGWLFIALWTKVSGGFNTFGLSVNSGRVLMFLLHLAIAYFIYKISFRYTNNLWASLLAVLVFTISPLAIYHQRRVLLDNIMVFWLLWSLVILLKEKLSLPQFYLSAVFFALAALTKEVAILFYPAALYLILLRYPWSKYKQRIITWLALTLLIISFYPLYAWTRGELWPNRPQAVNRHISLIETLKWQASRGHGLPFWKPKSDFALIWRDWRWHDPFLTIGGLLAGLLIILGSFFKKSWRVIALALAAYFLFLIRGKIVLPFYIIPLIPFFVISLALLFNELEQWLTKRNNKRRWWLFLISILILLPIGTRSTIQYQTDDTAPQLEAVKWIKNNLPTETKLAIEDYAFVDYHSPHSINDKVFKNAHSFWKIELDNKIKQGIFHNDWYQIKYIVAGNSLENLLKNGHLPLLSKALKHSRLFKKWQTNNSSWTYRVNLYKMKNTGHFQKISITETRKKNDPVLNRELQKSWQKYKEHFIHNYGQVIDPASQVTTSEGQSYAMLRAVWMDDEPTFRGVWQWTKDHFQFRKEDKLFSWKWQDNKLIDFNNATDADEDIALALILAQRKWGSKDYLPAAKELLQSIWKECVVEVKERYYLLPINHYVATQWNGYLFNPSYLSPAWYRIFAEIDQDHNWNKLANDSYLILNEINNQPDNKIKMPANWYIVENGTGHLLSAKKVQGTESDYFGFDAFRIFWRVALDRQWYRSQTADNYLRQASPFLTQYYQRHNSLPSLIKLDGQVVNPQSNISLNAGYLAVFMALKDQAQSEKFFREQIRAQYHSSEGYWHQPDDYYGNNWAWFATALYNGNLKK